MMKKLLLIITLMFFLILFSVSVNAELINTTLDVTDVSLHLIDGDNHSITDAQYSSTADITSGLSDSSDLTTYNTINTLNSSGHWKFEEGSGSTALDSSGNGNDGDIEAPDYVSSMGTQGTGSYALECNADDSYVKITDDASLTTPALTVMAWIYVKDSDLTEHIISNANSGAGERNGFVLLRHETGNKIRFQAGDGVTWAVINIISTTVVDKTQGWTHITATINSTQSSLWIDGVREATGTGITLADSGLDTYFCKFNSGASPNYNGTIDNVIIYDRTLPDNDIIDTFNNGLPKSNVEAIKINFSLNLDADNSYFLRVRKTTSGTDNISIYAYLNGSNEINTTAVDSATISQGWNTIPIINTFIDGVQALFRFYTEVYAQFSEVQLLEQVNDTMPPSVINCQVNDTSLTCDDAVKFSCNVTDTLGMDSVFFSWEDSDGKNYSQASIETGDIYTIEKQYSEITSGFTRTYNFTNATATDSGNNVNMTSFLIQYNYTCSAPDFTPPVIITYAINNSLIDLRVANQTVNFTVTDNIGIKNITYYVYNDSGVLFRNDMFLNLSEVDVDVIDEVDISGFSAGYYYINRIAYDTSNNSATSLHRVLVVNFDTLITLLIPANNSVDSDGYVEFSYSINIIREISLYIDGILNQTMDGVMGINVFPSPVIFTENRTAEWYVKINTENIDSETFIFNLSITEMYSPPEPRQDEFVLGQCPADTVARAMMFIFFVVLAFAIILIGYVFKNGLIGSIGSLMLIGVGVYMWYCLAFVSLLMMMLGVALMSFFVFRGVSGFR